MTEEWRDIPGFEGAYQVSDLGRVRSLDRVVVYQRKRGPIERLCPGRVLRPGRSDSGHFNVVIGGSTRSVHKCVLLAFVGPCPDGAQSLHLNGDEADNRLSNLAWGSRTENGRHRKWHKGQANYKLQPDQAAEIKRALLDYRVGDLVRLADAYGVSPSAISKIRRGLVHVDV